MTAPAWLRRAGRLPLPWLAALLLAPAVPGLYLGAVRPAERTLAGLDREIAGLHARTALAGPAGRGGSAGRLAEFYGQFPDGASAPDWLEKIQVVAQAHRLQLAEGEYRLAEVPGGRLARYQMTLPLQGAYPDIRGFLNAVLAEVPAAALDNVSFERQKIGEPTVRATVRLTLYLRRAT